MSVHVEFNKAAVMARIHTATEEATYEVANELLKDANFYARKDSGVMIELSQTASQPEKGILVWGGKGEGVPYAKRMYYTGVPVKDTNPNASLMWAHKAARKFKAKYQAMAQKILDRRV